MKDASFPVADGPLTARTLADDPAVEIAFVPVADPVVGDAPVTDNPEFEEAPVPPVPIMVEIATPSEVAAPSLTIPPLAAVTRRDKA